MPSFFVFLNQLHDLYDTPQLKMVLKQSAKIRTGVLAFRSIRIASVNGQNADVAAKNGVL